MLAQATLSSDNDRATMIHVRRMVPCVLVALERATLVDHQLADISIYIIRTQIVVI